MEKEKDIITIAKKIGLSVKEFSSIIGNAPQSLNYLKKENPKKYRVQTLGIMAKYLNLSYDDLIMMANLKKQFCKDQ